MIKTISLIGVLLLVFMCGDLFADAVYLKNGSKVTGIIVKESDDSVDIKINIGAVVTFFRRDIERVEKDADNESARLEESWEAAKMEREKREIQDDYADEERAKGLVEYKGELVTPEEKERLQAASIASEADKGYGEERVSYSKNKWKGSTFANKLINKGNWYKKETENFVIFYRDLEQAKIVSDKAEYYLEKIAYDLGYKSGLKWKDKSQVYIVENVDKWKDFLKDIGFNPDLVGGFVPNYKEKEMFLCALSNEYLAVTFPHELTHLVFREIAGDNTIPLWLNEGLANYEASITSISNKLLVKYMKQGNHILLGDLLRMANYPNGNEMRELFYAQSEKLVEFLIVRYGREKFRDFCGLILKDKSFHDSIFEIYKDDFKDIEDFNMKLVEYIVK
ncbi:MAG: peptidase MA family metallohydrolase [Candidatus Omnitrophota bacterium]